MGAVAGASTPLLSTPSTPLHVRRRQRRHDAYIDPLLVLDPDSLHVALQLLSAPDFNVLQQLSSSGAPPCARWSRGARGSRLMARSTRSPDQDPLRIRGREAPGERAVPGGDARQVDGVAVRSVRRPPSAISRHHIVSIDRARAAAAAPAVRGTLASCTAGPAIPGWTRSSHACNFGPTAHRRRRRRPTPTRRACYAMRKSTASSAPTVSIVSALLYPPATRSLVCKLKIWPPSSDCPVPSATTRHANASCRT